MTKLRARYYVHKNVNPYFTEGFGHSAVIRPHDIGESPLHVLAPIHSYAATVNSLAAVVTDVLLQADTLFAVTARLIGLDDSHFILECSHLGLTIS